VVFKSKNPDEIRSYMGEIRKKGRRRRIGKKIRKLIKSIKMLFSF
jgi:hypothetical protein